MIGIKIKPIILKKKIINLDKIIMWIKNGFEIGSHSLDHKNLTELDTTEKAKQIIESKKFLMEKLNIDVKSFSYPFGQFDDHCVKIIKQNYEYAVTTKRSRYKTKIKNRKLFRKRIFMKKKSDERFGFSHYNGNPI